MIDYRLLPNITPITEPKYLKKLIEKLIKKTYCNS